MIHLPSIARFALFILPLSLDTLALSLALGVQPMSSGARVRLAATFACFEAIMPAVGLFLGMPLGTIIGGWSVYAAGALLFVVGLWMLREGDEDDEAAKIVAASQGLRWSLVWLGLSVSLDELAIGFSFGVLGIPVAVALPLIGGQALVVSLLGQSLGRRLGGALGEYAERSAAVVLCLLGIALVVTHLLGIDI